MGRFRRNLSKTFHPSQKRMRRTKELANHEEESRLPCCIQNSRILSKTFYLAENLLSSFSVRESECVALRAPQRCTKELANPEEESRVPRCFQNSTQPVENLPSSSRVRKSVCVAQRNKPASRKRVERRVDFRIRHNLSKTDMFKFVKLFRPLRIFINVFYIRFFVPVVKRL